MAFQRKNRTAAPEAEPEKEKEKKPKPQPILDAILTAEELAEVLDVHPDTIREWKRRNPSSLVDPVPCFSVARQYGSRANNCTRYHLRDVLAWLKMRDADKSGWLTEKGDDAA